MNAETLAALERLLHWARFYGLDDTAERKHIAAVSAHIADLQNGGERAKVVAWLRAGQADGDDLDNHAYGWAADAIEAGAHMGGDDADG